MFFKECICTYMYIYIILNRFMSNCVVFHQTWMKSYGIMSCFFFWIVFFLKIQFPIPLSNRNPGCCEDIFFQESNIAMGTHFGVFRLVNTMKHGWPCSIFLICYNQKHMIFDWHYWTWLLHRNLSNLLASRRASWLLGFPKIDSIGHLAHL